MAPNDTVTEMLVARLDRIEDKVDMLITGQIALKVKMAFIGGIAGLVVSGAVTIIASIL